jgi:glycosyltransferase involved in cell wall biosynthesis
MVNKFYPPDIGGVETVVEQYARAAHAAGHEVEVLTCHSRIGTPTQTIAEEGVRVTRCKTWGTFWSMPVSPQFLLRYLSIFKRFDLIHFHEPFPLGTFAAVLTWRARPYVITWHSDVIRQRVVRPLLQPLQRLACKRAALVTTTSDALAARSSVLSKFGEKVRIIPLSIDPDPPYQTMPDPLIAPPYCLYLGRLASYKGLDTLVAALKSVDLRSHKLVIAGQGPEREWLRRELQDQVARVIVIDRSVTEAEKHALLAHCSFLVFPSSEENEAFGIIQLEAMAHGKPVINTNLPTGVPWVSMHQKTGLTVEPRNPEALAGAIKALVDSDSLRTRLGNEAKQRVATLFADHKVLPKVLALYGEALRAAG